jgi:hypothetical protein
MANRLTPLGLVLKWLIAPVAVGTIGYYLVGPRVESKVTPELLDKVRSVSGIKTEKSEEKPEATQKSFTQPQVDVTVTALKNREESKPRRRRRKRPVTPPVESAPAVPEPTVAPPPPVSDGTDG